MTKIVKTILWEYHRDTPYRYVIATDTESAVIRHWSNSKLTKHHDK